jgi:5-methylthioadenosine/S-adenosylhomocysteine deaminase
LTSNLSCFRRLEKSRDILIQNAKFVLTPKGPLEKTSIYISDRKIAAIGEKSEIKRKYGNAEKIIDATNSLVIPGLINNHSHVAMALLRGLAEDLPLFNWLRDKVWPIEAQLKPWQIEVGAILGATEALLSGTTTINTNYIYDPKASEASAIERTGMRGLVSHGIFDWTEEKSVKLTKDLVANFHGKDHGRIRIAISPHSAYSCSPGLLKRIRALKDEMNAKYGRKYSVLSTVHAAESLAEAGEIKTKYGVDAKRGIIKYLESIGFLDSETIIAHSIHLTDDDYGAYSSTKASFASCPISNLKVGVGVADLPRAITNGITVSLGTDGPASNNTLDMFETMKMASLLAKGLKGDTTQLTSKQTVALATQGGAKSLRQEGEIGKIAVGFRADISLLDLSRITALPFYDPYSYLAFAARSGDVSDVLVDGRILVRNRQIQSVDLKKLRERVLAAVSEISGKD